MASSLGSRLKKARRAAGFSQEKLAVTVGIARETLRGYESDETSPQVETLLKIAKVLGVEPAALLDKRHGAA